MTAQEIRAAYLQFFKDKNHAHIPRASLVPKDDPTTLFTGSGMQPIIPYLLGKKHQDGNKLVNSQTCLRAEDMDDVGDNRHTTFFEMLGNWSLGDYFKQQQIEWMFEFLNDVVELDMSRVYITCYSGNTKFNIPKDTEAADVWAKLYASVGLSNDQADVGSEADGYRRGMKAGERIFYYDGSKNWWSRNGDEAGTLVGDPCGPDSEMFYDFGTEHDPSFGEHCHPNCDCGRFMEIGNNVFMAYKKVDDSTFEPLDAPNVDHGSGLERIAAAKIDSPDVFEISLFKPIISKLEELTGHSYGDKTEDMRVIADHMRAAMFMAVDGVKPSNKREGYVMRRLMRRAILKAFDLGLENNFVEQVAPIIAEAYRADFPELEQNEDDIIAVLLREEKAFKQTLRKGLREFRKIAERRAGDSVAHSDGTTVESHNADSTIFGEDIFVLYDTYGFPAELSVEQARKQNIKVPEHWEHDFELMMRQQRERSRSASKGQFKGGLGGDDLIHKKYHTATHLMYQALRDVLGDHVIQRGSNITEERLRFDFSHPQKMTDEEKAKVESIVNEQIQNDLKVSWAEYPTEEATGPLGALGQFGDRYGDTVKVYSMKADDQPEGERPFSFEICGGPHVERTSQLAEGGKTFKITKEQSSSAGVRRIKAKLI